MRNSNSKSRKVSDPVSLSSDRMAETPRSVGAPKDGFTDLPGMRKSTRYGILLYFLNNSTEWPLSPGQVLWIVYRARKFQETELLRAGQFCEQLSEDEKVRTRMFEQIRHTYFRVPSLGPKWIPEKRTIGIGYRDKGSLRPLHEQRNIGEEVFWDEDISYLLPLNQLIEGRWITAEEIKSLIGEDLLILALGAVQIHNFDSL